MAELLGMTVKDLEDSIFLGFQDAQKQSNLAPKGQKKTAFNQAIEDLDLSFNFNERPKIIAEVSGNHEGSKKKFLKLIKLIAIEFCYL